MVYTPWQQGGAGSLFTVPSGVFRFQHEVVALAQSFVLPELTGVVAILQQLTFACRRAQWSCDPIHITIS